LFRRRIGSVVGVVFIIVVVDGLGECAYKQIIFTQEKFFTSQ
jgi:hypothetical protein